MPKFFKKPKFLIPIIILLLSLILGLVIFNNFNSSGEEVAGVSDSSEEKNSSLKLFGKNELENLEDSESDGENDLPEDSQEEELVSNPGSNYQPLPDEQNSDEDKKDAPPIEIPDYDKVRQYAMFCNNDQCEVVDEFTERLVGTFKPLDYQNNRPFFVSTEMIVDGICNFDGCSLNILAIQNGSLESLYNGYFNPNLDILENPIFEISNAEKCKNPTSPEMFWNECVLNKDIDAEKAKKIKEFFENWNSL